ncbi:MAG TPA: LptF/LptG family permease [Gemmatimonadales bacterium]
MARPRVRILSRYLIREHLPPLWFGLATLTGLMLLNQIAKRIGDLIGKGLPWHVVADVFVLSLPFIIAMTLPMAVLVAVLYTFSQLAAENEITAMKAGGVSFARLLLPALVGSAVVAVIAFLWSDQILPRSNHTLRTLLVDIQRKKPSFSLREQVINDVIPEQFFLRATRIDPATNRLKDVTIYDLEDADRRRIIMADSGLMAYTPSGHDLYLTLMDGEIHEVKRTEPNQFTRTFFRVNRIKVANVANSLERTDNDTYRSDREMSVCQMEQEVAAERRSADRARATGRASALADLRRLAGLALDSAESAGFDADPVAGPAGGIYCRLLRGLGAGLGPAQAEAQQPPLLRPPLSPLQRPPSGPIIVQGATAAAAQQARASLARAAEFEVEIQKKFAIAASCVIFALVGVPVALRFPRGGVGLVIGMSLVVFTVYYVGLIAGEGLGNRMIVSPFFAMWTPNVVFGVLGLVGVWQMRREGGSGRSSSWSDRWDALLGWARRRGRPA